ncbi:zinc-ribbon domain-containing protein [Bacillus salipaludis]|uniref:Zinc-ribbon domain-containing protein n=1 Tax=Bacillus salipaludis TaxID=2547811 RepID=A0AA90R0T0_9BACI|nr:zinc-ribbon domain-containing protein [Bacillus salipaludis]MDQ6598088.1 zinc-ribbon domain-containing protein [Bacillus salipaludis]
MYLTDTHKELLEEWDYEKNKHINPAATTNGSRKRVWWKCKNCRGEWEAYIFNRVNGSGCPSCRKKGVLLEKSIAFLFNDLIKEWDMKRNRESPEDFSIGSQKKVWWICTKGHHYQARVVNRTKNGSGCPYCAGKKVEKNASLAAIKPKLLEEWNFEKNRDVNPSDFLPYSHKKVWWVCKKCNWNWEAEIASRSNGSGCPKCKNRKSPQSLNKS